MKRTIINVAVYCFGCLTKCFGVEDLPIFVSKTRIDEDSSRLLYLNNNELSRRFTCYVLNDFTSYEIEICVCDTTCGITIGKVLTSHPMYYLKGPFFYS